jgi:hypothetical protein
VTNGVLNSVRTARRRLAMDDVTKPGAREFTRGANRPPTLCLVHPSNRSEAQLSYMMHSYIW